MADCCLIKKVATVEVYENKNEVRAYGFMAGDKNTPMMEVKFRHLWGEENLSKCRLRWIIVDDLGSLLVGEVPIEQDNTASIQLPNELFTGERRMKVQLTVASCDGSRILNLQQFTDLKVINNLATNEVVEPVYGLFINQMYDEYKKYLSQLETLYNSQYGSLENLYINARNSLEQYLIEAENGGNAEFLQGYTPAMFQKVESTIANLKASTKYKLGDVVEVLGFHAKGDGSHHKRIAKAEDDGSGEQGQNGIWWCIVHSGEVNVSWFGAKGDGITDNSTLINNYISKNIKYRSTDASVLLDIVLNDESISLFIPEGVFLISETIFLPRGVKLRGNASQSFGTKFKSRKGVTILHYTGSTKAISNVIYNNDLSIYNGIELIRLSDFNSTYLSEKIEIRDLEIYSPNADVSLYINGAPCSIIDNVRIGLNSLDYTGKVGIVIGNSWHTEVRNCIVSTKSQGIITFGSTGGLIFSRNYISRAGGSSGTKDEVQVYNIDYSGSTGVVLRGRAVMENNIIEHWFIPHTFYSDCTINNVHIETGSAEVLACYIAVGDNVNIDLNGECFGFSGTVNGKGSILLKDFGSNSSFAIYKIETFQSRANLISREGSSTGIIYLNGNFNSQAIFGSLNDSRYLKINNLSSLEETIYVSNTGDDSNFGIRAVKPLKTLTKALEMATIFNTKNIKLLTDITLSSNISIGSNIYMYSDSKNTITCGNFTINTFGNLILRNLILESTANPSMFITNDDCIIKIISSNLSTTQSLFRINGGSVNFDVDKNSDVSSIGWRYAIKNTQVGGTFSAYIGTSNRKIDIDSNPTQNVDVIYYKTLSEALTLEEPEITVITK